jgi:hypothetical protein
LATNIYGDNQLSFNYKHILILMFDNRTLIITNEFHMDFLHDVFISTFQRDVDQMVTTWNVHRVHKITENGRFIPSYVLEQVFQCHER